jgi:hypothetical protein
MNRLTLQIAAIIGVGVLLMRTVLELWAGSAVPAVPNSAVASAHPRRAGSDKDTLLIRGLAPEPLGRYSQSTSRPVFFEGRRYPEREIVAVAPPSPPPPVLHQVVAASSVGFKLMGLQIGAGSARALIEVPSKAPVWYGVGDQIEAWTIQTIMPDSVLLVRGSQSASLNLYSQ